MRDSYLVQLKRVTAGFFGMLMLLTLLLCAFFITAEADHECVGDDCPVCACILECEHHLQKFGNGIAVHVQNSLLTAICMILVVSAFVLLAYETLASQKVRLNN